MATASSLHAREQSRDIADALDALHACERAVDDLTYTARMISNAGASAFPGEALAAALAAERAARDRLASLGGAR